MTSYLVRHFTNGKSRRNAVSAFTLYHNAAVLLRTVTSGNRFLCNEVNATINKSERSHLKFSRREMELLQLITEGKSVEEQANKMNLSQNTIRNYHQRLNNKMNTYSKSQMMHKAKELKLV